jgi:hypothetical protein
VDVVRKAEDQDGHRDSTFGQRGSTGALAVSVPGNAHEPQRLSVVTIGSAAGSGRTGATGRYTSSTSDEVDFVVAQWTCQLTCQDTGRMAFTTSRVFHSIPATLARPYNFLAAHITLQSMLHGRCCGSASLSPHLQCATSSVSGSVRQITLGQLLRKYCVLELHRRFCRKHFVSEFQLLGWRFRWRRNRCLRAGILIDL